MNTPAHLLLGAAVFGRKPPRGVIWAAMLGGLLPDLSLYVLAGGSMFLLGISPQRVFNELYFSDAWQTIFAIDNSFLIWGVLLALAIWAQRSWAIALCSAALLHIACDLPLHHDDGRAHFWPLSNWVFESPLSYWDTRHGAAYVAPLEAVLATVAAIAIWLYRPGIAMSLAALALLILEYRTVYSWLFTFVDS